MEQPNQVGEDYTKAYVKCAGGTRLNYTDLVGHRVLYRYHRKDWSYFGTIIGLVDEGMVEVRFDSGDVVIRHMSSFDVKY